MTENQRTITIVDDCPEDRETIRSYLQKDQRYTYRIFEASDGENGLVLCKQVKPDVVLLDFLLSDMDALEFINKLKTQLSKTYLPVVVLTREGDETLALQTIKSGAQEYLGKDNITTGSLCRVIHNLLERTHLLSQIEEREARFRATFEQAAVGIAHVGLDGQWLLVNQKLCDIVGYTREELLDRTFQDLTHPDDLDIDLDCIRRLLAGEIPTYSIEKRYIHKDGTFVWINLTVSLVRASDGEPLYLITVIQDISDRKQAEEALRESELQLRAIFNGTLDAIAIADDRGRYVDANPAACELFGLSKEDLLNHSVQDFADPGLDFIQVWKSFLVQGQMKGEFSLLRPDGTRREVEFAAAAHFLPHRHLSVLRDISDRKQAQEALRQQVERQRLVTEMAQRIRQSLNLDEILNTTVEEVRQFLQCDRVLIFRFEPDWSGTVIVESVGSEWVSLLSTTLCDPCFAQRYAELSRQGYSSGYEDIYTAGLERCYLELLAHFQVRANLAVPILQGEHLWGLLIAHHCSAPRQWQPLEISLLKQLAMQVGIAIQQSLLFQQAQVEIAERRRVQEALRRERDFSKNLLDSSIDGILAFDCDCRYTLWNSGMERITGVSKQRVLGGTVFEVLPFLQGMVEERFLLETLAGNRAIASDRPYYIPETGQSGFFEGYYSPLYAESGEIIGGLGIIRDITKRKLAEQKIRQQAALLDVATDAIFVRSIENQILFWNRGAERLYGWQGAEAFGKNANQLLCKETPPQFQEALNTVIEKGFWQGELPKVTKSGKDLLVASRWTLMRDEAGNPKSILTVDTDITEKKQLETQFLRAQRLESLGTLASGIAHDLNNMLTPIMISAQMLLNQPVNERSQKLIQMIETNTKRGADLVKQVLSFTRGVEGKRVPLQIQHLLFEIEQIIRRTFPKSLEIFTNIPTQDLWIVCADATQLHQVFMNLCVNARDAMPNGGILSLSAENKFIDQNYARMHLDAQVGSYLVITVSDTGMGIPPELLERIFDPFFTTKEVGKGTGLGLSTVLGIVKSHGGFVNVYSQVGKGSQFKVYLPAMEGTAGQQAEAVELPQGQGELILVVDDEPSIREINKTSLEEHNYQVLTASDGIDAIALYAQHQHNISVVLMDLMMPSMDGSTAIRALKKMNPKVKIIATSGLVANGKFAEATNAGATTFLSKPYTVKELLETLNRVINDLVNC